MSRLLLASAAALVMTMGVAMAQSTTTSQTTTTVTPSIVTPSIVAPPVGTLSTSRTTSTTSSDGTQTDSKETTYRNTNGVADDSMTRTTIYPPVAITTTNTKSTTSVTE